MDWREIISGYLNACAEDALAETPESARDRCVRTFGTSSLRDREQLCREKSKRQLAARQVPAPADFQIVEETNDRVVAEVIRERLPDLPDTEERYILIRSGIDWLLDQVLSKCTCRSGQCFSCEGTGSCTACDGTGKRSGLFRRKCFRCRGRPTCCACGGSGRCNMCRRSNIPGWYSWTDLDNLDV